MFVKDVFMYRVVFNIALRGGLKNTSMWRLEANFERAS